MFAFRHSRGVFSRQSFVASALLLGCARQPYPHAPVVEDLVIEGVSDGEADDVKQGLATRKSGRLLYIWDGIVDDYETFDETVMQTDLERVERYFRARGYYEARVGRARVYRTDEHHVRVEVHVDKGEPVLTRRLELSGVEGIDIEAAAATLTSIGLEKGEPFDEQVFEDSKLAIATTLANMGYAYSRVEGSANVDISSHAADVRFSVEPGRKVRFGRIAIVGLQEIPEGPVRDAFQVEEGDEYSRESLESARRAVFDLGVFTRVVVDQDLSVKDQDVPVTLTVAESTLKNLTLGVGARIDVERMTGYLKASWEHRNFLGGLRRFTLSERPGVTAFPTRIDYIQPPTRALFENDVTAELRQPSFIEGRTTGWVSTRYSVYPLLYPLAEGVDPHQETIIGYHDLGVGVGLERAFFANYLLGALSYRYNANIPLGYQLPDTNARELVEQLDNVYVSYPELTVALDFRDDPVTPSQGFYVSNTVQFANPLLGGTVTDVRNETGLRTFYPLNRKRNIVLATRVKFGFVFPQNYGGTFDGDSELSDRLYTDPADPEVIADQQKILFRTFYSGGPNSNRGYAYRQVGPQGPIGFLLPSLGSAEGCIPPADPATEAWPVECLRALGGFSLWEASMEIRFPLAGDLYGTLFVDTSDVSNEVAFIRLDSPHLSVGPGLRYHTPIGPIRLDVGYRVPGLQVRESSDVNDFQDIAELPEFQAKSPFAYHIAIGEAF